MAGAGNRPFCAGASRQKGWNMSKKVIDVSGYQGLVDWVKVKAAGIQGAILKIIRKDLNPDKQFENNWSGCEKAGMPVVGVYNYSYATTVEKARSDAQKVVDTLAGRRAKVWMDVEDACLKGIGQKLIDIILAYQAVIRAAGLDFGVYTGLSFYNSFIKPYAGQIDCHFWIARYPSTSRKNVDDTPPVANQPLVFHVLEGWQWASTGRVSGISGNVDFNEWYGAIPEPESNRYNSHSIPERLLTLISPNMRGDDVKWVQVHLVRLGFLPDKTEIDGIYGPKTEAAVRAAQEHYGIAIDGIVGANTIYVIRWN